MKKLAINQFAYPDLSSNGIGEKNTVSNGPDDGTLDRIARVFWNAMRHGTTQQAVSNGLSVVQMQLNPPAPDNYIVGGVLSAGGLNISGHGNAGQMETGCGQTGAYDPAKYLLPWTEGSWGPELDKIRPTAVTYVSLWACHTGEGRSGSNLLYALAKRCDRAVRGGTGFLYVDDTHIWWENGSQWVVATPDHQPDPVAAPTPHDFVGQAVFEIGGIEVGPSEISKVSITLVDLHKGRRTKTVSGDGARDLVFVVFRSEPLDLSARVAGFVTGHITLETKSGQTGSFTVYNDRLALDEETKTGYYVSDLSAVFRLLS